jgi:2-oxoglutarate dehydrogenase E2 component (dihydrolipoamide succinyltransferase)
VAVQPAPTPAPAVAADNRNGPAANKMMADNNINPANVAGSGKDGRVTKGDVISHMEAPRAAPAPAAAPSAPAAPRALAPREERVKMTRLRQSIAKRLKEAQNTAAMLTTFNEVDMTNVMEMRSEYKDAFEKKYKVKLGFMSFFVKAAVNALKEFPAINAEIDGDDIIYKNYYDLGVAVSTPQGLVVPVVKDCDTKNMAQIEKDIADMGLRARDGKLSIDEMKGGTFTITNGGIFGSMLSTPILNHPQVAILGMHNIVQRPVVMPNGEIKARPIMYVAMSYDHRIVDGKEAVSFLVRIKQAIEDPQRLVLEV